MAYTSNTRKVNRRYAKKNKYRRPRKPKSTKSMLPYVKYIPGLLKTVGTIASLVNSEANFHDVTNSNVVVAPTGSVIPLSQTSQGDDYNNRTGRSILGKDIFARYLIKRSDADASVRVIIFVDKDQQGTDPTPGDVLQSATMLSPLNKNYAGSRFVILEERCYSLSAGGMTEVCDKIYIPYSNHIKYKGTQANENDQASGNVFMLVIGSALVGSAPTIDYYNRIQFYDN